jgi:uncharacterized membrane protein YbhN (UPF0104 family)
MSPVEAHAICLGLIAADHLARACRIQWIMHGLKQDLTIKQAFIINAFGDAANTLTPLRIGGEPARLAGMLRTRVPAATAVVGIGLEALLSRPVLALVTGGLIWLYAPEWWLGVGARLKATVALMWPWIALLLLVGVITWHYSRRVISAAATHLRPSLREALVSWKQMPRWPLVASIPLSLVAIAARVAILPVLALMLPNAPSIGSVTFGSFALLYSQMVLPTPSGAGAVELGFLGGAAGDLGEDQGWLLLAWRFYTSGLGVLLGLGLAVRLYGWPTLRKLVRSATTEVTEPADG